MTNRNKVVVTNEDIFSKHHNSYDGSEVTSRDKSYGGSSSTPTNNKKYKFSSSIKTKDQSSSDDDDDEKFNTSNKMSSSSSSSSSNNKNQQSHDMISVKEEKTDTKTKQEPNLQKIQDRISNKK